jgi:hypothetical protein
MPTIDELRKSLQSALQTVQAEYLDKTFSLIDKFLAEAVTTPTPAPTPNPVPNPTPTPVPVPSPTPTPTPIPSPSSSDLPNVKIQFNNLTFVVDKPGELWPQSGEYRWFWDATNDLRIILDVKGKSGPNQQCRVILQRCWTDVAMAPILQGHIKVNINGGVVYDDNVRIHANTRSAKTFYRLPITNLLDPKYTPNYHYALLTVPQILDIAEGKSFTWKQWSQVNDPATYDHWTEDYGLALRSWTGGVPATNEGSILPPWDVYLLSAIANYQKYPNPTPDYNIASDKLFGMCGRQADTSGNYAIHYFNRSTGKCHTYQDSFTLPVLVLDGLPAITSKSGTKLPIPDMAHCFGLPDLMALITGERYYIEELEAWTLLGPLARQPKDRSTGIYFSGQVRSSSWWLRNLFHLVLSSSGDVSSFYRDQSLLYRTQLNANLIYLNKTYADPTSPKYRPTGVLETAPYRTSEMMKYAKEGTATQVSTGNLYFLASVLSEIEHNGFMYGAPILDHVLKVVRGTWENSPLPFLAPWQQHAYPSDNWSQIMADTFARFDYSKVTSFKLTPLTIDYIAWWRSAVVAAIDAGQGEEWANEALTWVDAEIAKYRPLPVAWDVRPRV